MAGSWIVEASLTLENGTVASETIRYEVLSEASASETARMDHSEMQRDGDAAALDQAPASGETSAVYMRISNRSENDITISSVSSAAAEHIAFHESTVENDMARMLALDGLHIPAGEIRRIGARWGAYHANEPDGRPAAGQPDCASAPLRPRAKSTTWTLASSTC